VSVLVRAIKGKISVGGEGNKMRREAENLLIILFKVLKMRYHMREAYLGY
jgi:hypothetical protein